MTDKHDEGRYEDDETGERSESPESGDSFRSFIDPSWFAPKIDPALFAPKIDPALFAPKVDLSWLAPKIDPASFAPKVDPSWFAPKIDPALFRVRLPALDPELFRVKLPNLDPELFRVKLDPALFRIAIPTIPSNLVPAVTSLLRNIDAQMASALIEEGSEGPTFVSLLEWMQQEGPRLSPERYRQVLVALVWLLVFVPLVTFALENYEDAKVVSLVTGASAYGLAKDVATKTNKMLKSREVRPE